ncbi:MAG: hypothetical protein NWR72_16910 [Bacteroidia bacterium]|nr:hypothetical protein [Bacteroidia bacterium]
MRRFALTCFALAGFGLSASAQMDTRPDDHFWRRKVVNRIDLREKMNAPLTKRENKFYTDNSQYSEKEGLIMALFNGLKEGKYVAYHPDSISTPLSYDEVLERIRENEGALSASDGFDDGFGSGFDESGEGDGGIGLGGGDDGFFDDGGFGGFGDETGGGFDEFSGDDLGAAPVVSSYGGGDFDPGPYENVIHFVEDRIFDKVQSDMVYDIQFIEIIWTDPGETLPEKSLCAFRYEDVLETLDNSQWKNRFNDAEYKTLREVFELRLFHSFMINISGEGLPTLEEAEYRRQKMVEFEHHLWSY